MAEVIEKTNCGYIVHNVSDKILLLDFDRADKHEAISQEYALDPSKYTEEFLMFIRMEYFSKFMTMLSKITGGIISDENAFISRAALENNSINVIKAIAYPKYQGTPCFHSDAITYFDESLNPVLSIIPHMFYKKENWEIKEPVVRDSEYGSFSCDIDINDFDDFLNTLEYATYGCIKKNSLYKYNEDIDTLYDYNPGFYDVTMLFKFDYNGIMTTFYLDGFDTIQPVLSIVAHKPYRKGRFIKNCTKSKARECDVISSIIDMDKAF